MSTRGRNLLLFGPLLALWGLLIWVGARRAQAPVLYAPATQAVPAGPLVLATVDLRSLRGTSLGGLLGGRGERMLGADLRAVCGGDPFASAAELALAMPAAPGDGEFGVVVAGELSAIELTRCAERVIQARGGRPVTLREGDFLVVTDVASPGEGLVAVRHGGPLLFGGAPYVRRMMDTAARRAPSVEADARHVALRGEAGEGALVASALLTADLRERLRGELGEPDAPLAGVVGVGLSLGARDPTAVRLIVGCDSAAACAGVAAMLQRREPIAQARVEAAGPTARLQGAVPQALLAGLVAAVLR